MRTLIATITFFIVGTGYCAGLQETAVTSLPKTANSFETAKKWLYEKVYAGHPVTFYCGCKYDPSTLQIDLNSCGVTPRKNEKRARQVEAEHVFAAEQFGNFRECWRDSEKVCGLDNKGKKIGGRKCCEKTDPTFEAAHNDLHNLWPAVGEINGDRSNFSWAQLPNMSPEYGKCKMKVDESSRKAEPPDNVKGDVARTMFYMEKTYNFKLSDQDRQLFTTWAKMDPPDLWEYERNRRIAAIQGSGNPFITVGILPGEKVEDLRSKQQSDTTEPKPSTPLPSTFKCELRKTCKEMTNCEEAKYHLTTCGNKKLDRDGDGVPCESICK